MYVRYDCGKAVFMAESCYCSIVDLMLSRFRRWGYRLANPGTEPDCVNELPLYIIIRELQIKLMQGWLELSMK